MVRPSTQPSSRRRATKAAAHGAKPEALAPRNPIVGSLPVCCAPATSGHAAAAPRNGMNSRRLIGPPVQEKGIVSAQTRTMEEAEFVRQAAVLDVRFGSKADIAARLSDVRFTPKSEHRPDSF